MTNKPTPEAVPVALEICPNCDGSGVGVADTTCGLCNGSGGVPPSPPVPNDVAGLLERLELLAAWRKPGGPTPKQPQPNTYKVVSEAAATIRQLQAREARLVDALRQIAETPNAGWMIARQALSETE